MPTDCLLVSIDVSSLYTNIPHQEGKQAAMDYLSTNTSDPVQPEPEVIGELVSIVLENNIFEFNEKHYLQIKGTAMGTKMVPAYANLFMGKIELKLQALTDKIFVWKRFIDDIFIIWTGSQSELTEFLKKANEIHETIKFTFEVDETSLTFLDTTVYKRPTFTESNILDIRTHIKVTNKQLYVHATSYHPQSCKEGITKGETIRYLRTNSRKDTFKTMTKTLKSKMVNRRYNSKRIQTIINDIKFEQRQEMLHKQEPTSVQNKPLVLATKYSDCSRSINKILK